MNLTGEPKLYTNKNNKQYMNVDGEFADVGVSIGGRVTEVKLNSLTWTALPPGGNLPNRKAISIQNRDALELEIKVNYNVPNPLPSGYVGMAVDYLGERYYKIGTVVLYAKSISGEPTINVEEIA